MSGTATFKPKVKGAITGYLYELDQGGMMAVAVFEGREAYLANAARAANQVREKVERGLGLSLSRLRLSIRVSEADRATGVPPVQRARTDQPGAAPAA